MLAWLPALAYMALIWVLSSLSLSSLSVEDFPFRDKGVHFVEYGVLGFLLAHAVFRTWPRHHPLRTASLAVLVASMWALLDEIHQAFVPGRASDELDLLADVLGATMGVTVRYVVTAATRWAPVRSPGSDS